MERWRWLEPQTGHPCFQVVDIRESKKILICHVLLFDYHEISEWAPEYGPRLSELGLERYRVQEISRKKLVSCSL